MPKLNPDFCKKTKPHVKNYEIVKLDRHVIAFSTRCAINRRGFPNGQPKIYQGNQIYGFGCTAFEPASTWIFLKFAICFYILAKVSKKIVTVIAS